jgi:hypothetical protein
MRGQGVVRPTTQGRHAQPHNTAPKFSRIRERRAPFARCVRTPAVCSTCNATLNQLWSLMKDQTWMMMIIAFSAVPCTQIIPSSRVTQSHCDPLYIRLLTIRDPVYVSSPFAQSFRPIVGSDARFALQQHMTDTSVSRIGGANQIYRIP